MSTRFARITLALYLLTIYATLGVVRIVTNFLRDQGVLRVSVEPVEGDEALHRLRAVRYGRGLGR